MREFLIEDISSYDLFFELVKFNSKINQVIYLTGEIGSGKTTLVQNYIKFLDKEKNAYSPTFSIINEYILDNCTLYHYDLYRIENYRELQEIGIDYYFKQKANHLIEWPEKFTKYLPKPDVIIEISYIEYFRRLRVLRNEE